MDDDPQNENTALEAAKREVELLVLDAKKEPDSVVQETLQNLDRIRALLRVRNQDMVAWEVTMSLLHRSGIPTKDIIALNQVINKINRREQCERLKADLEKEEGIVYVFQVLPDAAIDGRFIVPKGWVLSDHGIFSRSGDMISSSPIIIKQRYIEVDDEIEYLTLQWKRGGVWFERTIERGGVARTSELLKLANFGLPITSINSGRIVSFLSAFEAVNLKALPALKISKRLGWIDDRNGFLCGRNYIGQVDKPNVKFVSNSVGDEQLVDSIIANGSCNDWKTAAAIGARYPRVRLSLYTALVPPILEIIRSPNFVVDLAGITSSGKTTTLRLCTSCWGNPDEKSSTSYLRSWNITRVYIERISSLFNGLPVILDDTKTLSDKELGVSVVYDIVSGIGRGRGSIKGFCKTFSWRTVLLSSGENPVTTFSKDGGSRARTLSLWGSPFGQRDDETSKIVQELDQAVKQNYGHAGPILVRYLVDNRNLWDEFRRNFKDIQEGYVKRAEGNPVAGRMVAYFAAITLAAQLAHEALDLPWNFEDPIIPLWDELTAETEEADPARKALEYIQSWTASHERAFYGRHDTDNLGRARAPVNGWAGRWDSRDNWQYIDFVRSNLEVILSKAGFDYEAVRRSWLERDWLVRDSNKKGTVKARLGKQLLRMVRLKREAWETLDMPEGGTS